MFNPIADGRLMLWRLKNREYWWLRKAHKQMPLTLYCGMPGSSKTLWMVRDAVLLMRQGYAVYSNLDIKDRITGVRSKPCLSWLDMMRICVDHLERGEVAYFCWDEIHHHADARTWALTPVWLLQVFAQRRHLRLGLIATTQVMAQVEVRLRTLVDLIVQVRPTGLRKFIQKVFRREFPLFWEDVLDGALMEHPELGDPVLSKGLVWTPWYVWNSYSTHEMVAGEDLSLYKDEEIQAEIAELTRRAVAVMKPSELESWMEWVEHAAVCPAVGGQEAASPLFGESAGVSPNHVCEGCTALPGQPCEGDPDTCRFRAVFEGVERDSA